MLALKTQKSRLLSPVVGVSVRVGTWWVCRSGEGCVCGGEERGGATYYGFGRGRCKSIWNSMWDTAVYRLGTLDCRNSWRVGFEYSSRYQLYHESCNPSYAYVRPPQNVNRPYILPFIKQQERLSTLPQNKKQKTTKKPTVYILFRFFLCIRYRHFYYHSCNLAKPGTELK